MSTEQFTLKKLTSEQLGNAYRNACMAELQALKPGNVHVFADGHGMTIHDFIKSADASAAVIAQPDLSVGERIYLVVEATQKAVGLNTNLGEQYNFDIVKKFSIMTMVWGVIAMCPVRKTSR